MSTTILAPIVLTILGIIFGIILAIASKEFAKCPKSFEGFPIALVAASLIALAFMGFSGLKVW